jgi:hypothetical protein
MEFEMRQMKQRWIKYIKFCCSINWQLLLLLAVLRIHDILVWIRIWIRGSMPLINGFGFGSETCYFRNLPTRCQQKTNFLNSFFAYYFLKVHLHHFLRKSQKEVTIQNDQGFLTIFARWRIRIHNADQWIRIRIQEAQKHVDPVDPDPDSDPDP